MSAAYWYLLCKETFTHIIIWKKNSYGPWHETHNSNKNSSSEKNITYTLYPKTYICFLQISLIPLPGGFPLKLHDFSQLD